MENTVKILGDFNRSVYLFDLYADLLSVRSKQIMNLYINEDYSISEIAEFLEISRQAVHDSIKTTEKKLEDYEDKLALLKTIENNNTNLELLKKYLDDNKLEEAKELINNLLRENN